MSISSTSSTQGSYSNPLRITGMATGLDTDSLVKAMMLSKTQPIDAMKQKQQILAWQRDQYRDMNTLFAGLQTAVSNLRYQYNFSINKASSDNTNVSVTANSNAVAGSYTMVVKQLASSASLVGGALGVASNQTQSLASQAMQLNITGATGSSKVNIAAGSSISSIVTAINGASAQTGVVASYDSATDRLYLNGKTTGSSSKIAISGGDAASQNFLTNTLKITGAAGSGSSAVTGTTAFDPKNAFIDSGLTGSVDFKLNGQTVTFNKTTTVAGLQTAINAAGVTGVTVGLDANHHVTLTSSTNMTLGDGTTTDPGTSKTALQELGLAATPSGNTGSTTYTGTTMINPMNQLVNAGLSGTASFQVNGATITFDNTTTFASLQSMVSSAAPGVSLALDGNNDVQLTSSGSITLASAASGTDGLPMLGLTAGTTNGNLSSVSVTGQDAIVNYNGVSDIHFQTNSFTLNNVTFSLTQPPSSTDTSASTGLTGAYDVHVTVGQDTDAIYNNIKSFVDAYNNIVDKVNAKISEQRYYDYPPLTDDQKAAMKDTDITNWNNKAQSGLLQNDDTLQNALSQLRTLTENPVDNTAITSGQYKLLSDIGITEAAPGSTDAYKENGKLYIDDAKLKAAIASNPDQVINMFTLGGNETGLNQVGNDQGFAERLYRASSNVISSLTSLAGSATNQTDNSSLGLQITDLQNNIIDSDSKLADYQQQYYSQFAQLESTMNQFNSQKQYLSSLLGGSSGQ